MCNSEPETRHFEEGDYTRKKITTNQKYRRIWTVGAKVITKLCSHVSDSHSKMSDFHSVSPRSHNHNLCQPRLIVINLSCMHMGAGNSYSDNFSSMQFICSLPSQYKPLNSPGSLVRRRRKRRKIGNCESKKFPFPPGWETVDFCVFHKMEILCQISVQRRGIKAVKRLFAVSKAHLTVSWMW